MDKEEHNLAVETALTTVDDIREDLLRELDALQKSLNNKHTGLHATIGQAHKQIMEAFDKYTEGDK